MLRKLGVLNAFSTYSIFNLRWVYQNVAPSQIEVHLYAWELKSLVTKDSLV
jgi:hypothetical protein